MGASNRMISISKSMMTRIVKGVRVYETGTTKSKSKFKQMFSLDKAVDVDRFSATLKDGVLVVNAPKLNQQLMEKSRKIPIVCIDDDSGSGAATVSNLENKETNDKVEETRTDREFLKNDCVKKVHQGNEKEAPNSENKTKEKNGDHDDNAKTSAAENDSEEKTN